MPSDRLAPTRRLAVGLLAALALGGLGAAAATAAPGVYWANSITGTIGRANLDGSGATQSLVTGLAYPRGVAVAGGHLSWANNASDAIGRANLAGTEADPAFITGASGPSGVATDGDHVY